MSENRQKYLLEPFLEVVSKNFILIRPGDSTDFIDKCSPEDVDLINSTNIYFICKKPRLRFMEDSLFYDDVGLGIGFELSTRGEIKNEFFILPNYQWIFPSAIEFSVHKEKKSRFVVNWSNGNHSIIPIELVIYKLFIANSFNFRSFLESEIFDYQVLYIGQSVGNAYKRIMRHEKLQQILSDVVENEPYNEVFVLLINMCAPYFTGIIDYRFYDDRSKNNFASLRNFVLNEKLSKKEIVDITEACLIKHFSPPYNVTLKNTFPNGDEKILAKFQRYNINSVTVIIDTVAQNLHLFSQKVRRNCIHKAETPLHKENNRIIFQDVMNTE